MTRSLAELEAELAVLIEQASDNADRYNSDGKYDHQAFTADLATIHSRALSLLREAGTETGERDAGEEIWSEDAAGEWYAVGPGYRMAATRSADGQGWLPFAGVSTSLGIAHVTAPPCATLEEAQTDASRRLSLLRRALGTGETEHG